MQNQWNSSCRILCISQTHCQKLSEISHCEIRKPQCQFRNANFAMPISQMPISQGQYTVHLSHIKHQNLSEISHCEIRKPLCEIRKPIAKFRKPLCQIRNPLPKFAISVGIAKFTLRNLQALSSSVINAEPPSIFGVLLFCPIT